MGVGEKVRTVNPSHRHIWEACGFGQRESEASHKWGRTYWIATRPSTLPIANPVPLGKQDITRVCHFNGDIIVYGLVSTLQNIGTFVQQSHLEWGRRVCEIENLNMTLCSANYHEWVRDVKGVAALGQLHSRDWIWCTHVPILDHTRGTKWLSL
jgi:hypothetical protein